MASMLVKIISYTTTFSQHSHIILILKILPVKTTFKVHVVHSVSLQFGDSFSQRSCTNSTQPLNTFGHVLSWASMNLVHYLGVQPCPGMWACSCWESGAWLGWCQWKFQPSSHRRLRRRWRFWLQRKIYSMKSKGCFRAHTRRKLHWVSTNALM